MFVWPTLNSPHQSLLKRNPPPPPEPSSSARLSRQVVSQNGHGLWSNTRLQTGLGWRMQVLHNCVLLWDSSLQTTVSSSRRAQPVRHSKPHWNVSSSEILTNLPDYSLPSASLWSFVVWSSRENFSARWKPLLSSSDLENEFLHSKNGNYNKCSQRVARCLFLVMRDPRSPAPSSSSWGVFYCPLKWKEISSESLVLTKASCLPASSTSPTQRALIWTQVWKILPPVCKHRNVWPCDIRGKRLEANI